MNDNNNPPADPFDDLTDQGNAARFIAEHGKRIKYLPETRQWLIFDGTRWAADDMKRIMELARETVDGYVDHAKSVMQSGDNIRAQRFFDHAKRSRSIGAIKSMVNSAAESHATVKVKLSELDRYPEKLNVQNGTVDLPTMELKQHHQNNLHSQIAYASFNPDAACPRWMEFLNEVFSQDQDLIRFVQRAVGYSLTGQTKEQCFFLCYGEGANGKSTFARVLMDVLGDYAAATTFDAFASSGGQKRSVRDMEALGRLQGIRLGVASETTAARRMDEGILKAVTGEDQIQGALMYQSAFDFRPIFKLWLVTNHLPKIADDTHAMWRRIKVIPFGQRFEGSKLDNRLEAKLRMEADGILTWAIKGAHAYLHHGLGSCTKVDEAVRAYRHIQDVVGRFIHECLELGRTGQTVRAGTLFNAWAQWCSENDIVSGNDTRFGRALAERGLAKARDNSGIVYKNVALKWRGPATPAQSQPAPINNNPNPY